MGANTLSNIPAKGQPDSLVKDFTKKRWLILSLLSVEIEILVTHQVWPPKVALGGGGRLGAAQHRGSIQSSHPAALGSILGIPKIFSLDVAEIY